MRILNVVTRIVRGGAQGTMLRMAEEFSRRGHEVACLYGPPDRGEGSYEPELKELGIRTRCVSSLVRDPDPWNDLAALRALHSEIVRGSYDIVHTYTSKAGFLGRLAAALAGAAAVVHSPQGHLFAPSAAIPGVSGHPLRRRLFLAMERRAARWADAVIALTPEEARQQTDLGIGSIRLFTVIPNPVEERFFAPRPPLSHSGSVVVVVGRLAPEKGHRFLFEAFARALSLSPDLSLWVVGDGPEAQFLKADAARRGMGDSVRFWGLLNDVRPVLAQADFLVLPSSYEAQGIVLLEAMAMGLPVVATRVGGVPRFIEDGANGLLVEFGDAEGLSQALARIASQPDLRAKLAAAGRARAAAYRPGAIADKLETLYRRLLARPCDL